MVRWSVVALVAAVMWGVVGWVGARMGGPDLSLRSASAEEVSGGMVGEPVDMPPEGSTDASCDVDPIPGQVARGGTPGAVAKGPAPVDTSSHLRIRVKPTRGC